MGDGALEQPVAERVSSGDFQNTPEHVPGPGNLGKPALAGQMD